MHRRGYATFRGEAPLRETLAAYLIFKLRAAVSIDENLTLIDPFAGSGTLPFEAISYASPNFEREYSWLSFKSAPKLFKSDSWRKNYRWLSTESKTEIQAFDKDDKSIKNILHNEIDFKKVFHFEKINLKAEVKDSATLMLSRKRENQELWVVTNPPYGIRLADDRAKDILESLEGELDGLIVLHPQNWKFRFKNLKLKEIEDFSNQGLNLKLSVYCKADKIKSLQAN